METIVILFLLVVGALCILAQAGVSVYRQREASAAAAAQLARTSAPPAKPAPRSRAKSASSAKASGASAAPDEDAPAAAAEDDEESTADRMLRSVAGVLGERTAAGAQLGLLGVGLMLIAVLMVLDVSVAFSVAT